MRKLNLGCGNDYKEGWLNCDFNKNVKADKYFDMNKFPYPFPDDKFDKILLDNVLEHFTKDKAIKVLEELHRIAKPYGTIEIYVPHFSGMYAFSHLTHFSFYGIGTFTTLEEDEAFSGERYSSARFSVDKEELMFWHHHLINFKFLSRMPINWMFNFNRPWQQLMERFQFLGFDEIHYTLVCQKGK